MMRDIASEIRAQRNRIGILITIFSSLAAGQGYTITNYAGAELFLPYYGDNGPATSAGLNNPYGVAVDAAGNVYIADSGNMRIRKVTADGIITTVAGTGERGYSGDGGPATSAHLNFPMGVAVDSAGYLYISDTGNHRIRVVNLQGSIYTVAGYGDAGYSGDNGPPSSASLRSPSGIAVFSPFVFYIADTGNNVVRKVELGGPITTVAGTGTPGYSGDNGPATSAALTSPNGVAVDSAGNLYIADTNNSRIRKVTNGVITTVVGTGSAGFSGDGGPSTSASVHYPSGVAVDFAGNLYFTDAVPLRVRKVSNGVISTIAGNGVYGSGGDGGPALNAQFADPWGIAAGMRGEVYLTDSNGRKVRRLKEPARLGALNPSQAAWILDSNGNYVWDGPVADLFQSWNAPNRIPVLGDWDGSGKKKLGLFDPESATWKLDINGNGVWDGAAVDRLVLWGSQGDVPVVGRWDGSWKDKIGTFNPSQALWLLDFNGNFAWDGSQTDKLVFWGSPGDKPVVGNWNGSGAAKIGIFNPSQGWWLLDYNGSFTWDGASFDRFLRWGSPGDTPVIGDWNSTGTDKIGVVNPAQAVWLLDYNGNYTWDGPTTDKFLAWGSPGDIPVVGDWDGTGATKIAVFNASQGWWVIDYNGNYAWEGSTVDRFLRWGSPGDTPVAGPW